MGERKGGYTSFEFDVARHWKSAREGLALREAAWGARLKSQGDPLGPTAPNPSLSKEGNIGLPSSDEEGLGVVGRRM